MNPQPRAVGGYLGAFCGKLTLVWVVAVAFNVVIVSLGPSEIYKGGVNERNSI
jgi:hypothetical protein